MMGPLTILLLGGWAFDHGAFDHGAFDHGAFDHGALTMGILTFGLLSDRAFDLDPGHP